MPAQLVYLGVSLAGSALLMRWVLGSLDPEKGNKKRVRGTPMPHASSWPRDNLRDMACHEAWLPCALRPSQQGARPPRCAGQGSEGHGEEAAGHEAAQHQQLRGCAPTPPHDIWQCPEHTAQHAAPHTLPNIQCMHAFLSVEHACTTGALGVLEGSGPRLCCGSMGHARAALYTRTCGGGHRWWPWM